MSAPTTPRALALAALAASTALAVGTAWAATSLFTTGTPSFVDATTHAPRYRGAAAEIEVGVCIVPGTANASDMERPVKNAIATWNKLTPTSANSRRGLIPGLDFESVLLHELGHCQGLGHVNLGSQNDVGGARTDYLSTTRGANEVYDTGPGPDGTIGTADDARGDDINAFRFFEATNNPYTLPDTVDATTYTRDVALLPPGDIFPTSPDHDVSALPRFRSRWSEASMNQGTFYQEVQRTLAHDDVAGIRYARAGSDHLQGTADDYTATLVYRGITAGTAGAPCDITAAMDAARTGFAVCRVGADILDGEPNTSITSAEMYFNPTFAWDFNPTPPCTASKSLPALRWVQVSLPCLTGVSTGDTVADTFGDDLGTAGFGERWTVYAHEYADRPDGSRAGGYRELALTDRMESGVGYWLITADTGRTIEVTGEYPSQPDVALGTAVTTNGVTGAGWNLVGNPFRNDSPWGEALVVSTDDRVLTLEEADPALPGTSGAAVGETACTAEPTRPECTVARFGYRYDPDARAYVELGASEVLGAFDGAWMYSGSSRARFRARMTAVERVAR